MCVMGKLTVGSICSGIEAASVAWDDMDFDFKWFSEISDFPSKLLGAKYPTIPNLGDMCEIPNKLKSGKVFAPDLICGGTPCQAFSLAGWKKGLVDDRGNLTLRFVDIIEQNDSVREREGKLPSMIFWENVEGVLKDKTNAFGCFLSSLAGYDKEIVVSRWPRAGVIHGPKRNIAWRVLDAKYFGLPQQRRRLYLLAGGKDFFPEQILFESRSESFSDTKEDVPLSFIKHGHSIEVFRSYTDCLYSAYGTKWNGNAAAYNGSLFVVQNSRIRRFTPLECERLMGFPDNYTDVFGTKPTSRYQSIGNSWAIPVIRWLGKRIVDYGEEVFRMDNSHSSLVLRQINAGENCIVYDLSKGTVSLDCGRNLNCSEKPERIRYGNLFDVIDVNAAENFYLTPVGCNGILRRRGERMLNINNRLESVLRGISSAWSDEKIEKISRKQSRGRFSTPAIAVENIECFSSSLFEES